VADSDPQVPAFAGRSLVPAFAADVTIERESLWWLHEGNRALRAGNWKLTAARDQPWELFDLSTDRAEQHDLARDNPERVRELEAIWQRQTDEFAAVARITAPEPKASSRKGGKGKQ
jgi:arylsulfatase